MRWRSRSRRSPRRATSVLCEAVTYTGMRSLANHLHVQLQPVRDGRRRAACPTRSRTRRSSPAAACSTACHGPEPDRPHDVAQAPSGNGARRGATQPASSSRTMRTGFSPRGSSRSRRSCRSGRSTSRACRRASCPACEWASCARHPGGSIASTARSSRPRSW